MTFCCKNIWHCFAKTKYLALLFYLKKRKKIYFLGCRFVSNSHKSSQPKIHGQPGSLSCNYSIGLFTKIATPASRNETQIQGNFEVNGRLVFYRKVASQFHTFFSFLYVIFSLNFHLKWPVFVHVFCHWNFRQIFLLRTYSLFFWFSSKC